MDRPHSFSPNFAPGTRLSRLPVHTEPEGLEDFYRDLFDNTGPEHDRQRLLRLLDEDVADGAGAKGRQGAMDHLDRAFQRIDAWTSQGDYLPAADRTELKRRVAHNLLAAHPGLPLAAEGDGPAGPDRGILRQVQAEHAVWRQGWAIDSPAGQNSRRPWDESPSRQPRQPWDERPDSPRPDQPWDEQAPRQGRGLADALRRLGRGEPLDMEADGSGRDSARQQEARAKASGKENEEAKKTCWFFIPEPTACDRCLDMAAKVYTEKPERPHPNCKCEIVSRELTAQEARGLNRDLAHEIESIRAERAAKPKAPRHVDDSQWHRNGDPVTVTRNDKGGKPVRQTFKGHVLPDKTPGGVKIKTTPNADRRVTKEMRDTLQEVLDDPHCKEAGIKDVTISATTNGKHENPQDRHYQGKAVDIAEINGKPIGKDEKAKKQAEVLQEVIKDKAKEHGIKDNLGPNRMDLYTNPKHEYDREQWGKHKDHVHIAIF